MKSKYALPGNSWLKTAMSGSSNIATTLGFKSPTKFNMRFLNVGHNSTFKDNLFKKAQTDKLAKWLLEYDKTTITIPQIVGQEQIGQQLQEQIGFDIDPRHRQQQQQQRQAFTYDSNSHLTYHQQWVGWLEHYYGFRQDGARLSEDDNDDDDDVLDGITGINRIKKDKIERKRRKNDKPLVIDFSKLTSDNIDDILDEFNDFFGEKMVLATESSIEQTIENTVKTRVKNQIGQTHQDFQNDMLVARRNEREAYKQSDEYHNKLLQAERAHANQKRAYDKQIERLQQERENIKQQLNQLQRHQASDTQQNIVQQLQNEKQKLEEKIHKLEGQTEDLTYYYENRVDENDNTIRDLSARIMELQKQQESQIPFEEALITKDFEISKLQNELQLLNIDNARLTKYSERQDQLLQDFRRELELRPMPPISTPSPVRQQLDITSPQTVVNLSSHVLEQQTQTITEYENFIQQMEQQIAHYETKLQQVSNQRSVESSDLKRQIQHQQNLIKRYDLALNNMKNKNDLLVQQQLETQEKIQTVQKLQEELTNAKEQLKRQNIVAQSQVQILKRSNQQKDSIVTDLENKIQQLEQTIQLANTDIQSKNNKLNQLNNEIHSLNNQLNNYKQQWNQTVDDQEKNLSFISKNQAMYQQIQQLQTQNRNLINQVRNRRKSKSRLPLQPLQDDTTDDTDDTIAHARLVSLQQAFDDKSKQRKPISLEKEQQKLSQDLAPHMTTIKEGKFDDETADEVFGSPKMGSDKFESHISGIQQQHPTPELFRPSAAKIKADAEEVDKKTQQETEKIQNFMNDESNVNFGNIMGIGARDSSSTVATTAKLSNVQSPEDNTIKGRTPPKKRKTVDTSKTTTTKTLTISDEDISLPQRSPAEQKQKSDTTNDMTFSISEDSHSVHTTIPLPGNDQNIQVVAKGNADTFDKADKLLKELVKNTPTAMLNISSQTTATPPSAFGSRIETQPIKRKMVLQKMQENQSILKSTKTPPRQARHQVPQIVESPDKLPSLPLPMVSRETPEIKNLLWKDMLFDTRLDSDSVEGKPLPKISFGSTVVLLIDAMKQNNLSKYRQLIKDIISSASFNRYRVFRAIIKQSLYKTRNNRFALQIVQELDKKWSLKQRQKFDNFLKEASKLQKLKRNQTEERKEIIKEMFRYWRSYMSMRFTLGRLLNNKYSNVVTDWSTIVSTFFGKQLEYLQEREHSSIKKSYKQVIVYLNARSTYEQSIINKYTLGLTKGRSYYSNLIKPLYEINKIDIGDAKILF